MTGLRLAIADPPYPPLIGSGGRRNRASRWYGTGQVSAKDRPADVHPDAAEWDDPARHQRLLHDLLQDYDGFAIATSPDGIAAYGPLPPAVRLMAWVKPNAAPGAHRLRSLWEAVILYPPTSRRSNRNGAGMVPDVLTAALPRDRDFIGAKPKAWVEWVLDAMGYVEGDTVDDLFPGSGAVSAVLAQGRISNGHAWGWKVTRGLGGDSSGLAMNRKGEFIYESRGDGHNKARRWSLDEALRLAVRHVDTIRINGYTASEASADVAARLAASKAAS